MPEGSGWDRQKGSERPKWYHPASLHQAWGLLIDAAQGDECVTKGNDALTFDIVDVGREFLSVSACNDAYDALTNASTPAAVTAANTTMSRYSLVIVCLVQLWLAAVCLLLRNRMNHLALFAFCVVAGVA